MPIRFGPAGNSEIFYKQGHTASLEAPQWLNSMGLNAYEYPCGRGVKIGEETARRLGENATKYNISLSLHAPYYINLASQESDKIKNSIGYIVQSVITARFMGAKRVVVHPGSCGTISRNTAMITAIETFKRAIDIIHDMKYDDIILCPETLGKRNQLGTLDEIIEFCTCNDSIIPTLDFGHINALGLGCLKTEDDYRYILEKVKNCLGAYRLKNIHCHFSRIEFTNAGEKRHWTLDDIEYGPEFEPLAKLLVEYDMNPIIICESSGTMAEDSLRLKIIYESFLKPDC